MTSRRSHGRDLAEGSKPFGAIDMELQPPGFKSPLADT